MDQANKEGKERCGEKEAGVSKVGRHINVHRQSLYTECTRTIFLHHHIMYGPLGMFGVKIIHPRWGCSGLISITQERCVQRQTKVSWGHVLEGLRKVGGQLGGEILFQSLGRFFSPRLPFTLTLTIYPTLVYQ